jgi:hypothetical protein
MEKETFLSGYCRCLDGARTVAVVTENGKLVEVDCSYENCPHTPTCPIAKEIKNIT